MQAVKQYRQMKPMGGTMNGYSAGEIGGIFAGIVALLAAIGKGLAWLLNWHGERSDAKSSRLREWEVSLDRREIDYRANIETKLVALEGEVGHLRSQVGTLGLSLLEVTGELRALDPESPALRRAMSVLRCAFPPEYGVPTAMAELAAKLDQKDDDDAT